MAVVAYPLILKDDYEAFRQIVSDLPERYEQWLYLARKKRDRDRLEYETGSGPGSFQSHDVRVNGGRFQTYCGDRTPTMLYSMTS
jgi:hypothetical protein